MQVIGKFDVCKNKIIGRRGIKDKIQWRLDFDPIKGPHINIEDYRFGKFYKDKRICIPFKGNEKTVEKLLKPLNNINNLITTKIDI